MSVGHKTWKELLDSTKPWLAWLYLLLLFCGFAVNILILVSHLPIKRRPLSTKMYRSAGRAEQKQIFVRVLCLMCASDMTFLAVGAPYHWVRLWFDRDIRIALGDLFCKAHVFATSAFLDISVVLKLFISGAQVVALYPHLLTYKRIHCPHADWMAIAGLVFIVIINEFVRAFFVSIQPASGFDLNTHIS